jgi:hypothetical protein
MQFSILRFATWMLSAYRIQTSCEDMWCKDYVSPADNHLRPNTSLLLPIQAGKFFVYKEEAGFDPEKMQEGSITPWEL